MFFALLFVTLRLSAKELLQCIGSSKSDILLLYYTGVTEASSGSWVTMTAIGAICCHVSHAQQVLPDASLVTFLDIIQVRYSPLLYNRNHVIL